MAIERRKERRGTADPNDGDLLQGEWFLNETTGHWWSSTNGTTVYDTTTSGASGYSGYSGYSGTSGYSGHSGYSGTSGYSGYSGISGYSGTSGYSGGSGYSGIGTAYWSRSGTVLLPTTNGDSILTTANVEITGSVNPVAGNALIFNNTTNAHTTIANASTLQPVGGRWTVSVWIKFNSWGGGRPTLSEMTGGTAWYVFVENHGASAWIWSAAAGVNGIWIIATADFVDGDWHHLVLVQEATAMRLYLDNVDSGYGIGDAFVAPSNNTALALGTSSTGSVLDGAVDELNIWTRAVSAGEVATLWASGGGQAGHIDAAPWDTAVAGLHFDESSGTAADFTGNSHTGTLSSGCSYATGYIVQYGTETKNISYSTGSFQFAAPVNVITGYSVGGTSPIADGTYTVGNKITPVTGNNGTITTKGGIITAIQQAT